MPLYLIPRKSKSGYNHEKSQEKIMDGIKLFAQNKINRKP